MFLCEKLSGVCTEILSLRHGFEQRLCLFDRLNFFWDVRKQALNVLNPPTQHSHTRKTEAQPNWGRHSQIHEISHVNTSRRKAIKETESFELICSCLLFRLASSLCRTFRKLEIDSKSLPLATNYVCTEFPIQVDSFACWASFVGPIGHVNHWFPFCPFQAHRKRSEPLWRGFAFVTKRWRRAWRPSQLLSWTAS